MPSLRESCDQLYISVAYDVHLRFSIQVSDLSAFDGRVLAYRGIDG